MLDWVTTLLEGLAALCAAAGAMPHRRRACRRTGGCRAGPAGRRAGARCRVRRGAGRRRAPPALADAEG